MRIKILFILLIIIVCLGCESPKEKITNPLGMQFVYIKPGTFMMGPNNEYYISSKYQNTTPREVTLTKAFYMQTTETTVGQWKKFIKKTGYITQAELKGMGWSNVRIKYNYQISFRGKKIKGIFWNKPGYKFTDKYPVIHISWKDTQKFIEWLNKTYGNYYRLPTEAEWEYACRAGTTTHFYNGNLTEKGRELEKVENKNLNLIAWYGFNSEGYPHPVGLKKPNIWGLYDMHGNVKEYCQDYFKFRLPEKAVVDPLIKDKSLLIKVFKGGAWNSIPAIITSSSRDGVNINESEDNFGFRVVKDIAPKDIE